MNNEENKLDKQIGDLAEMFKGMFSEEELKHMEELYNTLLVKREFEEIISGSKEG